MFAENGWLFIFDVVIKNGVLYSTGRFVSVNDSRSRLFSASCIILLAAFASAQQPPPSPSEAPIPTWENEIAKNYLPYHQLKPEDFPIDDKAHPEMAYWVAPFVHYYFHFWATTTRGGMVYANVTDWTVFSGFDKNLSSRSSKLLPADMKSSLPYIQAMLDVSELHARKLAALKAGDLPSGQGTTVEEARAQLKDKIAALVQVRAWEAQKETDALAKATDNGRNKNKVRECATAIKKRLAEIPPASPPPNPGASAAP
jgi:hypothetical protein